MLQTNIVLGSHSYGAEASPSKKIAPMDPGHTLALVPER